MKTQFTPSSPAQRYRNAQPLLAAVDCIIFGVDENILKLLVFKREVEPLAGQWSLLGSFINADESVDSAAERVLKELTGLENLYMEQLRCYGQADRDPGERVLSIAYWSLIRADHYREFSIADHHAEWVAVSELPELVLDHPQMVQDAVNHLRERAKFHPVGFELLPEQFTLPQLLRVYEAIFGRSLDDRNFRKKLLKANLIERLDKKDMSTSKKGSYLYKFKKQTYRKLSEEGYSFGF